MSAADVVAEHNAGRDPFPAFLALVHDLERQGATAAYAGACGLVVVAAADARKRDETAATPVQVGTPLARAYTAWLLAQPVPAP